MSQRTNSHRVAVHNASFSGRAGLPFFSPYVPSKFAVVGFAECLRLEMRNFGVAGSILDTGTKRGYP